MPHKTQFQKWLSDRGATVTWAAGQMSVNRAHLSRVVNGHHRPGNILAKSIERLTDGQVPASQWKGGDDAQTQS